MNNTGRFALGAAIGLLVGSAVAYFWDAERRRTFVKSVNDTADKAKDSVVEGYYEAKERYEKYRDALKKRAEKLGDDVEEVVDKVAQKTKKAIDTGADKAKEVVDKAKN